MSAQIGKDPESTTTPDTSETPEAEHRKTLWERIPRRLFRGRVRTTTAALVVLFIAALFLYGQRSDHYTNLDEENRQNQISQVQQQRTTTTPEPTVEETPESTPSTTTTPTTTVPPTGEEESSSSSSEAPTTTTTTPGGGGFRLPELPTISIAP